MANLNRVEIIGNVGADPEARFTPEGKMVTNFSVAVNDNRGENPRTIWFNVTCWEKLAEACNKYLSKGSLVWIEGRIDIQIWQDQDGGNLAKLALVAKRVVFLSQSKVVEHDEENNITDNDDNC